MDNVVRSQENKPTEDKKLSIEKYKDIDSNGRSFTGLEDEDDEEIEIEVDADYYESLYEDDPDDDTEIGGIIRNFIRTLLRSSGKSRIIRVRKSRLKVKALNASVSKISDFIDLHQSYQSAKSDDIHRIQGNGLLGDKPQESHSKQMQSKFYENMILFVKKMRESRLLIIRTSFEFFTNSILGTALFTSYEQMFNYLHTTPYFDNDHRTIDSKLPSVIPVSIISGSCGGLLNGTLTYIISVGGAFMKDRFPSISFFRLFYIPLAVSNPSFIGVVAAHAAIHASLFGLYEIVKYSLYAGKMYDWQSLQQRLKHKFSDSNDKCEDTCDVISKRSQYDDGQDKPNNTNRTWSEWFKSWLHHKKHDDRVSPPRAHTGVDRLREWMEANSHASGTPKHHIDDTNSFLMIAFASGMVAGLFSEIITHYSSIFEAKIPKHESHHSHTEHAHHPGTQHIHSLNHSTTHHHHHQGTGAYFSSVNNTSQSNATDYHTFQLEHKGQSSNFKQKWTHAWHTYKIRKLNLPKLTRLQMALACIPSGLGFLAYEISKSSFKLQLNY